MKWHFLWLQKPIKREGSKPNGDVCLWKASLLQLRPCWLQAQAVQSHMCSLLSTHWAAELLILHQVCSVFNYRNIITHSHSQLGKLNNHAVLQLTFIPTSYLYFWSFNIKLMSLRACSDSPSAEQSLSDSRSRAAGNLFSTTALQAELFLALPSVGGGWHDGFLSICTLL